MISQRERTYALFPRELVLDGHGREEEGVEATKKLVLAG